MSFESSGTQTFFIVGVYMQNWYIIHSEAFHRWRFRFRVTIAQCEPSVVPRGIRTRHRNASLRRREHTWGGARDTANRPRVPEAGVGRNLFFTSFCDSPTTWAASSFPTPVTNSRTPFPRLAHFMAPRFSLILNLYIKRTSPREPGLRLAALFVKDRTHNNIATFTYKQLVSSSRVAKVRDPLFVCAFSHLVSFWIQVRLILTWNEFLQTSLVTLRSCKTNPTDLTGFSHVPSNALARLTDRLNDAIEI